MDRSKKKGSITVEAVFVVPLCLLVIFVLLECGLCLHHKSWYTEAAWECVLADKGAGKADALAHWEELTVKQVLPVQRVSANVSDKGGKLTLSVQGRVSGLWGSDGMDFAAQAQREQIKPAEFVRRIQLLKKLGKDNS